MKVIIIGGGLIGVTAAYCLARRGYQVIVLDRESGVAQETSFANGGLLTPSMAEPWNTPGCWRVLIASLGRSDAPLQLRLKALPSLMRWGVTFVRCSERSAFERSALANLRLALHSLEVMDSWRKQTPLEYDRAARGSLRIFRESAALDAASEVAAARRTEGLSFARLSGAETVRLEPALAPIEKQLAGAIYYPVDEIGDAYRFCEALAGSARQLGAMFRFRTHVKSLDVRSGRIAGVLTDQDRLVADRYVLAAGSYCTPLLRSAGVHLPVRPAKGYSVTFENEAGRDHLRVPIIDDHLHAAVVPLANAIRVAGTAEFAGYDLGLNAPRIRNLVQLVEQILPEAPIDTSSAKPWCGLRPMSVDGVPIIGRTSLENLFLSTGHGHLGWTMAAGSAQLLAELISDETPACDPRPYSPARFLA